MAFLGFLLPFAIRQSECSLLPLQHHLKSVTSLAALGLLLWVSPSPAPDVQWFRGCLPHWWLPRGFWFVTGHLHMFSQTCTQIPNAAPPALGVEGYYTVERSAPKMTTLGALHPLCAVAHCDFIFFSNPGIFFP